MSLLSSDINKGVTASYAEFMNGMDVDTKLASAEIRVQSAWLDALKSIGFVTAAEAEAAQATLADLMTKLEQSALSGNRIWENQDEDIHLAVERILTDQQGDLGRKLHTGRSRNDLIATTLRLFVADQCLQVEDSLKRVALGLVQLATRDLDVIVPGQTHRQSAQPVRMGHIWNAFALHFTSDIQRIQAARKETLSVCPLGSAAFAGTHLPVDLEQLARQLGFALAPLNSIHSTSDRDFAITFAQSWAFIGLHLTRLCEDIIYSSSTPLSLVRLPVQWSSGSSLMPNKRNPDFFEVLRAKSKRLISISREMMDLSVSLPMGYASDFHEQKRALVQLAEVGLSCLSALAEALTELEIDAPRARALLEQGHVLATDYANHLVGKGLPFRIAYKEAASEVATATLAGHQLTVPNFSYTESVEARSQSGGTSRARVAETTKWIERQCLGDLY